MNVNPVDLAGIPKGGITKSGDRIWFQLDTLDDRSFQFSCPHEAIGEIVESLLAWADLARSARNETDEAFVPFSSHTAKARLLSSFEVGMSRDATQAVLKLKCGPVMAYSIALPIASCKEMSVALATAHSTIESIAQHPTGPAN